MSRSFTLPSFTRARVVRAAMLVVALLAALAGAKKRHCAEALVNEALESFDDYACVTDMKSCIGAGTCMAAGIEEKRLCECYLQVGSPPCGCTPIQHTKHPRPYLHQRRCNCRCVGGSWQLMTASRPRRAIPS